MEAVESLGYRMNQVARSLKTNRTHSIGIIAPEFKNDFFMSIVTGIEDSLKQMNYTVILCSSRESLKEEEDRMRLLKEKNVDGVIIIPGSSRGEHFGIMENTPIVLVDRLVEGFESDAVLSDNLQGSYEAVDYSLKRGARRIGFIGGDMSLTSARERYEGYLSALKDFKIEVEPNLVLFGDYHEKSGYQLMQSLMEQDSPPDHVFISNYFMHLGAARFLLQSEHKGLHILSFDDLPLAAFFPYTSIIVAQPMEEIGRKAAELLIQRIGGSKEKIKILRLPTQMRVLE
jgi:LacI family transcriptional regulator